MPIFIQPSFAKGEIAPALHGRVDTAAYQVALRTARNVHIHSYGGVSNRPGTVWLGPVKDHTYRPVLLDFQFKTEDTYILEFGDQYMRVIRNDAHVLDTSTVATITGITVADPPVVTTSSAHGFSTNDEVFLSGVLGMVEVDSRRFDVNVLSSTTFELLDQVDGTDIVGAGFTAWTSGGTATKIYEISTPYLLADLPELKWLQNADVMTLTHKTYPAMELGRAGHDDWTLAEPSFTPSIAAPTGLGGSSLSGSGTDYRYTVTAIKRDTLEESSTALLATSSTITGITQANPAVVTTSAAHGIVVGQWFHVDNVVGMTELNGRRFRAQAVTSTTIDLEQEDSTGYGAWSSAGDVTPNYVVVDSGATPNSNITWIAEPEAERYIIYREDNGLYGFIGETEALEFTDVDITPDKSKSIPRERNPFRLVGDYPGAASYFEQRRVFGGSDNQPDTSNYSKTGAHSNMGTSNPIRDDDSITATLNARQVNEIRHFVPLNDLLVFTSGGEWKINSGADSAFSLVSLNQKPQSEWGSGHQKPIVAGTTVMFVEDNNSRIRSFGFSLQIDGYTGADLTQFASHLFEDHHIVSWSYTFSPEGRAYVVRSDGQALTLTFNQEQEVIAWTRWDTLGKFEWTASTRKSTSQTEDGVFFVVKRTINGRTVRYIERLASRRFTNVKDCFFVDSGLSFDNPVTITGATSANPVVMTAPAHGFLDGDEVDVDDIIWTPQFDQFDNETQPVIGDGAAQLNGGRFTIANKTTNTFELVGVDGSAYAAYVEGGAVRKTVSEIRGYDHLEGVTGIALVDGDVTTGITVTGGVITLPVNGSRVHFGLKFIADIELLDIEAPDGTIQGRIKRIPRVTLRMEKSRGILVGPNSRKLTEMKQRELELMGEPTALLTGDFRQTLNPSWGNGRIFMRQRNPLPITLLAVIPEMDIGG